MTTGIHHITAITTDAQKNYDFYTEVLGLRFVKKTVNFDAPDVYHLYYGNESGEPGTALTFFVFEDAGTGFRGVGQVTKIYFAVPMKSLSFWLERLITKGVKHEDIKSRFLEKYITFYDPDGLQLEIVATTDEQSVEPYVGKTKESVPEEYAIRGFYGAELAVESEESIADLLTDTLGYSMIEDTYPYIRYENKTAKHSKYIDLIVMSGWPKGVVSAGTNHHIAFEVKDENEQSKVRQKVIDAGFNPTETIDRDYFKSIYFQERNGIIFEVATSGPGFTIDEDLDQLGTSLRLPKRYEPMRSIIEAGLPELYTGQKQYSFKEIADVDLFKYKFVNNKSDITYVLFHGTGGDEKSMLDFAKVLEAEKSGKAPNWLAVRGNTSEMGLNRFFKRYPDGSFDETNIKDEAAKLAKFLKAAIAKHGLSSTEMNLLGYSNGANFAIAFTMLQHIDIAKVLALHPMTPLAKSKMNLQNIEFIITGGETDSYTSTAEMEKLQRILNEAGASVVYKQFLSGHEITQKEIEYIAKQL